MKDQFKGGTQIWTSRKNNFSSFGNLTLTEEQIQFSTGLSTLEIRNEQIIELRFYWGFFPRVIVIGQNETGYCYGTIGFYRRKTGRRVYNAIQANGYTITLERAKFGWIKATKEMNLDMEQYGLKQPSG